jgi:hypothetical protein
MTSFNPAYYLKHAWNGTSSVWGKICIVLFYTWLWLQIIWAVQLIVAPMAGWSFSMEGVPEYWLRALDCWTRGMNVMALGFFLYADRGGIKLWNVAMVTVINTLFTWVMLYFCMKAPFYEGAPEAAKTFADIFWVTFIVLEVWILLALVASALEKQAAPAGSSSETTPLV